MKKLLALVLCVMLFVSVIPAAAFAGDSASSSGKMDKAYAEVEKLYAKYAEFGAKTIIVNIAKGFAKAEMLSKDALEKLQEAFDKIDGKEALSYTEVFDLVGEDLYTAYAAAGEAKVQKAINEIDKLMAAIEMPEMPTA